MRIGLDVDGVVAKTPVRFLAVRERRGSLDEPPENAAHLYERVAPRNRLRAALEYLRFAWRIPGNDIADVLRRLALQHQVHLLTGRSEAGRQVLDAWLRRYGLLDYISSIRMAPKGLRTWEHKLVVCRELQLDVHVDDDPHTALYLARNGVARVFLIDPSLKERDASNVTVVRDLSAVCDALC